MKPRSHVAVVAFVLLALATLSYLVWFTARVAPRSAAPRVKVAGVGRAHVRPQVIVGLGRAMVLAPDGGLWGWGESKLGELGVHSTNMIQTPRRIGQDADWQSVATGSGFTIASKTNGTLWVWGARELGAGTNTPNPCLPRQFTAETSWNRVIAGAGHILAQKTDGTVWTWGFNNEGQLGDGTTKNSHIPTQVGDGAWKAIAVGAFHSAGIRPDGTLWVWGRNPLSVNHEPTRVSDETNWQAVFAGEYHTVGSKTDGTWWIWGDNAAHLMGDTNATPRLIEVEDARRWAAVAGGNVHSLAIADDGTLWAWGVNRSGELGDETTLHRKKPVRVGSGTNWIAVAAEGSVSVALASDGTLWTWGIRLDVAPEIRKNVLTAILHIVLRPFGVEFPVDRQIIYSHSVKPELIMQFHEIADKDSQEFSSSSAPTNGLRSPQH